MPRHYRKYSNQQLEDAIKSSKSWSQVITKLGLKAGGGTYENLKKLAQKHDYSYEHFTGKGWNVGVEFRPWNTNKRPLEEYFLGRPIHSDRLKRRLWSEGLKKKECENCGLTEWLSKEAPLELDHIDGDRTNNRLDNLRILCCNCHALTDTYCNKTKVP